MSMKNRKEDAISTMDDLLGILTQSMEWQRIKMADPWIGEADAEQEAILDELLPLIGKQNRARLEEIINNCSCAIECAAILYGLHVADSIRTVSAAPSLVSQHIVDRVKKGRETA